MRVKEEYMSFTGLINIGKLSKFIKINKQGYDTNIKEVIENAKHFSHIVLYDNPFIDREDVSKLIKGILKHNPETTFDIYCTPNVRPIGVGKFENINYYVKVPLKKSGIEFNERINTRILTWFIDAKAKFIFNVETDDEIDEVATILNTVGIPRQLVYLSPNNPEQINKVMLDAAKYNYNFVPDFKKFLWNNFGRE